MAGSLRLALTTQMRRKKNFVDTAQLAFERKTLWLRIGATKAKHNLPCTVFQRPRSGFVICWSLAGLYRCLGFDMFHGVASQWAYKSLVSLSKLLGEVSDGLLHRSQEYASAADDLAPTDRCLPFHAVSTLGLIVILPSWCGASPRQNGLRKSEHREAARSALSALVDAEYEWRWPRPLAGEHAFQMQIEDCGRWS